MKRKIHYKSSLIAKILYLLGIQYGVSTNIADETSFGYGKLDDNGFWQYPIYWEK